MHGVTMKMSGHSHKNLNEASSSTGRNSKLAYLLNTTTLCIPTCLGLSHIETAMGLKQLGPYSKYSCLLREKNLDFLQSPTNAILFWHIFGMCGSFGNTCTCVYNVSYCLYWGFCIVSFMYIYSYLFSVY